MSDDREYTVDRQIDNIAHDVNGEIDGIRATIERLKEKVKKSEQNGQVKPDE